MEQESWKGWDYEKKEWVIMTWDGYTSDEPWCEPDCWERAHCGHLDDPGHFFCGLCPHGIPRHHLGSCEACKQHLEETGQMIPASKVDDITKVEVGKIILI